MAEEKIIIYSQGIIAMSICADNSVSVKEIEVFANTENPTGIDSKWKLSEDKTFKSGESNPCKCDKFPNTRKHYLLNC